ncbi:DUF4440 domain-containing protein [Nocardia sp. CDC159]|uniref:DUF4440 domain-containing protein n=1 Tax=Nocardia pulmonis TaxID=2951408 RepID=A0A9X2IV77_9NOCA|nr:MULTISPECIES: DUF4440 domain-containing protein [Nocardia]MCM6772149.1 DUF4440 domain-containing protein [Nocardia pulmonis]MCM6785193.1 DUF4440 domain-containing protein [Nocardia sp. CDC159]
MDDSQPFIDEIIDFHRVIIDLFAGTEPDPAAAVAALLTRFDPDFTMITPTGALLTLPDLRRLFEDGYGCRPDFAIEITDIVPVTIDARGALVSYQERQQDRSGASTRRSTAYFTLDSTGAVRWRHLQETWVAG